MPYPRAQASSGNVQAKEKRRMLAALLKPSNRGTKLISALAATSVRKHSAHGQRLTSSRCAAVNAPLTVEAQRCQTSQSNQQPALRTRQSVKRVV